MRTKRGARERKRRRATSTARLRRLRARGNQVYQSKSVTGKANIDLVEDSCVKGVEAADNTCENTISNFYFAGIEKVALSAGGKILV
jgi:hypothetical protein